MSVYPHSRLFLNPTRTVVVSGPYIQVVDSTTGAILHTTSISSSSSTCNPTQSPSTTHSLPSGQIRCVATDIHIHHIAAVGDDKLLKVWKVPEVEGHELQLLNVRELPKKPTGIAFTNDEQTILVSDKFGDVFSYSLLYAPEEKKEEKKDALASHENPSNGHLVLGHVSPLNAFLLTPDERYILTADRDEHIRVSWYPEGYVIEMFCLGHRKFVSSLHIPSFSPSTLISGGGDPELKMWDWMSGTVTREVRIWDAVEPFLVVRAEKRKRDQGEDGERGRKKLNRGQGKGKAKEGVESEEPEARGGEKKVEVLVVRRIESIEIDGKRYIVFSAVGTTALFMFDYDSEAEGAINISHFDFEKPVIDFTVWESGVLWVNVDGEWVGEGNEDEKSRQSRMVRALRIRGGAFCELLGEETNNPVLFANLNSLCIKPATLADLKTLDLYGDLVSMPKYEGPQGPNAGTQEDDEMAEGLSKKELGRLKSRKAVAKVMKVV